VAADTFGAIVLSGGGAARLGGADKASIEVGDRTLLEHAIAALVEASEIVVVGSEVPTSRPVTFTREDPTGGGPVAGLLAGISAFARTPDRVVVLAVDMPLVSSDTVRRLLAAAQEDGAVLVDASGRDQYLCAAYSVGAIERASSAAEGVRGHGVAVRDLVGSMRLARVAAVDDEAQDLDTWEDLARFRDEFGQRDR
jgi:molybdopterin-guanine dinucleotide biosynthesis protein A